MNVKAAVVVFKVTVGICHLVTVQTVTVVITTAPTQVAGGTAVTQNTRVTDRGARPLFFHDKRVRYPPPWHVYSSAKATRCAS